MQTHKEQLAGYKDAKSSDQEVRVRKKSKKKPFVLEYRIKQDYPNKQDMLFEAAHEWALWGKYSSKKSLIQAIKVFDHRNDDGVFERRSNEK